MARASRSDNPIEKLLNDRNQYLSWLARLDTSGDAVAAVPEGVRHKIRGDYEARLKNVVDELRHHSTAIDEQLEEYRARKHELTNREAQAKELMSEAEVRHAVGEYDEVKWQTLRGETTRVLVTVREELAKTNAEIDRLTEVQALIAAPLPPPATPAEPPPPAPAPAARHSGPQKAPEMPFLQLEPDFTASAGNAQAGPPPIIPPEPTGPSKLPLTAKNAPKVAGKGKDEPPARTLWYPSGKEGTGAGGGAAPGGSGQKMDELAFLKSVTNEPTAPRRASGGFSKVAPPEPPQAAAPPTPPPPPPMPHPPSAPVITTADPFASKAPPADAKRGSQANVPKTLKCAECGTLNRPTEWYCERCGAELAAL
jgi:hypothetical protein